MCTVPRPPVPVKPSRKLPTRRPHRRSFKVLITAIPEQPLTLVRITQDDKPAHYWVRSSLSFPGPNPHRDHRIRTAPVLSGGEGGWA
jgi:hypothetical protein